MIYDIMTWIFWGVVVGFAVAFVFPETKKYLLGTVLFGVMGSVFGGIMYGFFKISEEIYFHQGSVIFILFIILAFILTSLSEKLTDN